MSRVIEKIELLPDLSSLPANGSSSEPPDGIDYGLVRVAADGKRIAWAMHEGPNAGIWVGEPGSGAAPVRIASAEGWRAEDLAWSPDGERIAWLVGGGPPPGGGRQVAWGSSRKPGEEGRVDGASFAWTPKSGALVVADLERRVVVRHGIVPKRTVIELAALDDDGDPHFPVRLAVSPDGTRLAFTSRRVNDAVSELWIVDRKDDRPHATLLTEIPGSAVHVLPFWSPRGMTLAMAIVHLEQERSAIVAVPRLEGEGVILYDSSLLDRASVPAWSPSSKSIAFLRTEAPAHEFTKSGPPALVLLAADDPSHAITPLSRPGEVDGDPKFLDERTLVVDGKKRAWVLRLQIPA